MVIRVSRNTIRLIAVIFALSLLALPASAFVTHLAGSLDPAEAKRVEDVSGPPRDGYTAITTQQFSATYPDAELVVLAPNGTIVHVNTRYDSYFDVDPLPGRPWTIEYVASEDLPKAECDGITCTRQVFVRENFKTGESRVIWSTITPKKHNTRVHDIDRINETHIVVADIYRDAVFVYDTERGIRTWAWHAQRDFPITGGGPFPDDWTHVNDVEVLSDGVFMVSLRNQDSVVFLARNGTLLSSRTLGEDERLEVLYRQHNPDYLSDDPPTVLAADSHNNRVVEYERVGGEWERTWMWRDAGVQWPRDADRLPNNHTLVTDTNGGRVVEVNESGAVVWSVEIGLPYEAERLSTGDESAGGLPASRIGLSSRGVGRSTEDDSGGITAVVKGAIRAAVPSGLVSDLSFILPDWAAWWHLPLFLVAVADLVAWGLLEFRWSSWRLTLPMRKEA